MGQLPEVEGLEIRYTVEEDGEDLKQWLMQPGVLEGFPMSDAGEVADSVKHWIGFARYRSCLTAVLDGKPVGIATICLMPYKKLAHHSLLSIIVSEESRGKGVGTVLMNNLLHLAKNYFNMDVIYLEVYEGNRAMSLYHRFGFKKIGEQKHFMKEGDRYISKIIMERVL